MVYRVLLSLRPERRGDHAQQPSLYLQKAIFDYKESPIKEVTIAWCLPTGAHFRRYSASGASSRFAVAGTDEYKKLSEGSLVCSAARAREFGRSASESMLKTPRRCASGQCQQVGQLAQRLSLKAQRRVDCRKWWHRHNVGKPHTKLPGAGA